MNSCLKLIRKDLRDFAPYSSARKEAGRLDIMLNANECACPNPLYPDLQRYPNQQPQKSLVLLASFYKARSKQLLLSRGSDEAIELLIRLFCQPAKDAILICPPTFGMYAVSAKLQAVNTIEVPLLEKTFELDIDAIERNWEPNMKLIFLCSPNNPTGNLITANKIKRLCQFFQNKAIVVVDEAYIEFASEASASRFINDFDNLVVLRTLSKAFGLAGARCGIALSNQTIIQNLLSVMAPYPIPRFLETIINQNLQPENLKSLYASIESTKTQRNQLVSRLKTIPFINSVQNTEANFILITVNDPEKLLCFCKQNNILLRNMNSKLKNTVRISIGSEDDIEQLMQCLEQYND